MLYPNVNTYCFQDLQQAFLDNWNDWCLGGPKDGGWTRLGPPVKIKPFRLVEGAKRIWLEPLDVLAKNLPEVLRWHVDFLNNPRQNCPYYHEYLLPRMPQAEAEERASQFLNMCQDMKLGYDKAWPVKVADIPGLAFQYFRFDGCHRAACAYVLGLTAIPANVFSVVIDDISE